MEPAFSEIPLPFSVSREECLRQKGTTCGGSGRGGGASCLPVDEEAVERAEEAVGSLREVLQAGESVGQWAAGVVSL